MLTDKSRERGNSMEPSAASRTLEYRKGVKGAAASAARPDDEEGAGQILLLTSGIFRDVPACLGSHRKLYLE